MLVQFPEVTVDVVMKLVQSHLELGRGGKPSEEREACVGKVFALLALVRSGRVNSLVRHFLLQHYLEGIEEVETFSLEEENLT